MLFAVNQTTLRTKPLGADRASELRLKNIRCLTESGLMPFTGTTFEAERFLPTVEASIRDLRVRVLTGPQREVATKSVERSQREKSKPTD